MKQLFKIIVFLSILNSCICRAQHAARDTNILARVMNFNWTPNGKSILFTVIRWDKRVRGTSQSSVFKMDIQSGKIDKIIGDGSNNPAMSPNGKFIAYTKDAGERSSDIYIYDLVKKESFPLATDTTREIAPNWSPDGKYITYCAEKNKAFDVYVVNVRTKESKQITSSGKHRSYSPAWSPDGKHIVYYFETGDNRDQIFLTDPQGNFHKNLTNDTTTHNFYPSWVSKEKILYTRNSTGVAFINTDGSGIRNISSIRTYFARHHPEKNLMLYDLKKKTKKVLVDEEMLYKLL